MGTIEESAAALRTILQPLVDPPQPKPRPPRLGKAVLSDAETQTPVPTIESAPVDPPPVRAARPDRSVVRSVDVVDGVISVRLNGGTKALADGLTLLADVIKSGKDGFPVHVLQYTEIIAQSDAPPPPEAPSATPAPIVESKPVSPPVS